MVYPSQFIYIPSQQKETFRQTGRVICVKLPKLNQSKKKGVFNSRHVLKSTKIEILFDSKKYTFHQLRLPTHTYRY